MVSEYYFSRRKVGEKPHFYNYFLDQQPPYDVEIQLPAVVDDPITFTSDAWFRLENSSGPMDPDRLIVRSQIWDFKNDESLRVEIKDAYQVFLSTLDKSGLRASVIQLIKTRLAEVIPLTFTEVLFYHYGLNPVEGWVDLQPGMRLRVDHQSYQMVHPAQDQRLHGYSGSGSTYYEVAEYRHVTNDGAFEFNLSFDPFVAGMQNTVVETLPGDGSSVAGVIDLHKNTFRRPYLRLFYPGTYPGISSAGWFGTEKNVTMIGSDTFTALTQVTEDQILKNGELNNEKGQAIYFRGRAAVIPEIVVFVNGKPEYVSLGTTLRQLMVRYLSIPGAKDGLDLGNPGIQEFKRLLHHGSTGNPVYRKVHFEYYQAYADGTDIYDIPLLKGDKIRINNEAERNP